MPIYEYDCPECGRVEAIQKISDKPLRECPQCLENGKHSQVTKVVSPAAFHLKGSGWYKTDYAASKNGSSSAATSEKSVESKDSKGSTGDAGTSDAKPAKCKPGCGCH